MIWAQEAKRVAKLENTTFLVFDVYLDCVSIYFQAAIPHSEWQYKMMTEDVYMLDGDVKPGEMILAEAVATSILVLAVLMVASDENNKSVLGPLAIGLAMTGGIIAV